MQPTAKQRQAKARFFSAVANNPLVDATLLPTKEAARLAAAPQLVEWLQDPEFRDWFYNKDAAKQLLETGVESSIRRLINIVEETNVGPRGAVRASDQVSAARYLLEFAGMAPAKTRVVEYKDKQIGEMSEDELRTYISKHTPKLLKGGEGA